MIQKFIKIYGYLVLRESNLFGRYQEKILDRAYEINKEMFQAAMDGLIGDVDKKYRYGEDNQIPSNDVPVAEFMHRMNDMNLDFVVSDTPKPEEKKSSAVVEVYPQTEEVEYHLEPAKVSNIDTPQNGRL